MNANIEGNWERIKKNKMIKPGPCICATCKNPLPRNCETRKVWNERGKEILNICQCEECINNFRASFTILTCAACGKTKTQNMLWKYNAGENYCSRGCYQTLFRKCIECGKKDISTKWNIKHGSCGNEKLCDRCYNRKHGLGVLVCNWRF